MDAIAQLYESFLFGSASSADSRHEQRQNLFASSSPDSRSSPTGSRHAAASSFLSISCSGFRNHGALPTLAYHTQPSCHINDISDEARQLVLVARDVDNLEDKSDGRGPLPKIHLLVAHAPCFDPTDQTGGVRIPKSQDTAVSSADAERQTQATLKFMAGLLDNTMNLMPGTVADKEALHEEMQKSFAEFKKGRNTDYLRSVPWRPITPSMVDQENGVRGIEDEFPHRIVFSVYSLDTSFHDEIKQKGVKNWDWVSLHNLFRKHILERVDTEAIAIRRRPVSETTKVLDYRNPEGIGMKPYKDAFSYMAHH
eukprot:CAMPEP_0179000910 /NCGR_PEP_ID=MMETSP0795-20121207/10988_1 /TAXON_ID=88552 /ORGANISM="Amoebophrya sp., Strain Ameob2" /LENGTH=310 /DNA_ID=CAMNT_0020694067 /DNA_START=75 /DNA_END=1007 /DNA_ORIENTATION=+